MASILMVISNLSSIAMGAVISLQIKAIIALFLIAVLSEMSVPFPFVIDTTVLFVGYHSGFFSVQMLILLLVLYTGGVLGSGLVYLLARILGKRFIILLAKRRNGLQGLINRMADKLSRTKVPITVAMARLTPGLLTPVSIASGCIALPFQKFVAGLGIATFITDAILITIGIITRDAGVSHLSGSKLMLVSLSITIALSLAWALGLLIHRRLRRTGSEGTANQANSHTA